MSIYALADPNSSEIRYVGKTRRDPHVRLLDHVRESRKPYRRQRRLWAWLRSLGCPPMLIVLERDPPGGLDAAEQAWIAHLTAMGCRLCNMTPGGEGQPLGYKPSEATLAKLRAYRHSPESRAKISASLRGHSHSAETRAKMSAAATGRPGSMKGRKMPKDAIERTRLAHLGSKRSDETRRNIAISKLGRALTDEEVRQIRASTDHHRGIAANFGISKATVYAIRANKAWDWVK